MAESNQLASVADASGSTNAYYATAGQYSWDANGKLTVAPSNETVIAVIV